MNGYNPPYFISVYGIIYMYNTHGQKGHITINGLYGGGTSGTEYMMCTPQPLPLPFV